MQRVLQQHPAAGAEVLVVWEPILPMDWMAPTTLVMRRISDQRVRQFWDPQRVIAGRMAADARPPQPRPRCFDRDGVLWDLAAVYPRGVRWETSLPPANVFDGPVVDAGGPIDAALSANPRN